MTMTQPQDNRVPGSVEDFIDTMKRAGIDLPEEVMTRLATETASGLVTLEAQADGFVDQLVALQRSAPHAPVDIASIIAEIELVVGKGLYRILMPMMIALAIIRLEEATR